MTIHLYMGASPLCRDGKRRRVLANRYRRTFAVTLTLSVLLTPASFSLAAEPPTPVLSHDALMTLGRDFVTQVGGKLQEAELFLSGAGKLQLAEHAARTELPDNEPLLFHGTAGPERVNLRQDILTIKRNHRLLVSLGDFCSAADLAITVSPKKGTAAGWFIREDQSFSLDAKAREAVVMGKKFLIKPDDISADEKDILVSSELLEKWFGFDFKYNLADLALQIQTTQPLPLEETYRRSHMHLGGGKYVEGGEVQQPFQKTPYALLSQPYFDTNISGAMAHTPGQAPTKSASWSTIASNDIAGFNMQTFAGGTGKEPYLSNLRLTLGKQDVEGNLLGPLHATSYQLGDVNAVSPPLIGGGGLERGVLVSNTLLDTTTETTTQIRGNAQPGWDVELYRNNSRLDLRHVDATGLYEFKDVDLIVGDNDFKLLFYGPQGQIREEHRKISVDPALLAQNNGHYSFSATQNNITNFRFTPSAGPGTGDPNVAATYEYSLGRIGAANFGLRRHSDNGTERTFAQTGLASYLASTYLNANVGYDLASFATTEELTARRNFGLHSSLLQYTRNDRDYNISSPTGGASLKDSYRASLGGPLPLYPAFFDHVNYSADATYGSNYNGSKQLVANSSLSTRVDAVALSGSLAYTHATDATGVNSQTETADLSSHGFFYGGSWRLDARYNISPITQLTESSFEYNHALAENLDSTTQIIHRPDPKLTSGSVGLNWRTGKATVSPSVAADTSGALSASINMHFGLAAEPYSHSYSLYNAYLSNSGGVAGRIFLDKNGDGIFDGDDELLSGVTIRALQSHRSAVSDERGIAFIADLEENHLTDVIIDPSTFKDSFDLSLFDGVSLRPHPGEVTQLEFPVVVAGEMDGQANFADNTPARNLQISLTAPDGRVEKFVLAASDGYWAISSIRPGVYYLNVGSKEAEDLASMVPEKIVIQPTGTTLYGQKPALAKGHDIPFLFRAVDKPDQLRNHPRVEKPEDVASTDILLHLGSYHSRLGLTFSWYRFRFRAPAWNGVFALATPLLSIEPNPKTAAMELVLRPLRPLDMKEAAQACQDLQDLKFDCSVELVSHYAPAPAPPVLSKLRVPEEEAAASSDSPRLAASPANSRLSD